MAWRRFGFVAAFIWLIVVAACAVSSLRWFADNQPQTALTALLPESDVSAENQIARARITEANNDLLTLLVKVDGVESHVLQNALDRWVQNETDLLTPIDATQAYGGAQAALKSIALEQMTLADQKAMTEVDPSALFERFVGRLTQPAPLTLFSVKEDPFGFAANWMLERAANLPVTKKGDLWVVPDGVEEWLFSAFKVNAALVYNGSGRLNQAIENLKHTLSEKGTAYVLAAGMPIFSDHAAQTAQREISILGSASALLVVIFAWIWFRRLQILGLVLLVIAQATIVAIGMTLWICDGIHLIALVFGTSLIGITIDYTAHYFGKRYAQAPLSPQESVKRLFPSLSLALASTLIAFVMMAMIPMTGVKQMAVFCASGIVSAFCAVMLWLPILDCAKGTLNQQLARIGAWLNRFPRLTDYTKSLQWLLGLSALALCAAGAVTLKPSTSLYELNNAPQSIIQESAQVTALLKMPSSTQYFIVKGESVQAQLLAQETLNTKLNAMNLPDVRFSSMSDWVMSDARRGQVQALQYAVIDAINPQVTEFLGSPIEKRYFANVDSGTRLALLQSKAGLSELLLTLTPEASLVQIRGLTAQNIASVRAMGEDIAGVTWVDFAQEISETLQHYRDWMTVLLFASFVASGLLLFARFGREAWRAFIPTVLGLAMTVSLLSLCGMSFSLFTVLALILLLGLGFDYGIFMTSARADPATSATVAFAALTTFVSFGLLSFSSTPALQTFGLTVGVGQCMVWALTTFLRKDGE